MYNWQTVAVVGSLLAAIVATETLGPSDADLTLKYAQADALKNRTITDAELATCKASGKKEMPIVIKGQKYTLKCGQ